MFNKINTQVETITSQGGQLQLLYHFRKIIGNYSTLGKFPSIISPVLRVRGRNVMHCSNEKETNFDNYGKQTIANGGVANSPNIFVADNSSELRDLRQLTPPLPFTVRAGQVCEVKYVSFA